MQRTRVRPLVLLLLCLPAAAAAKDSLSDIPPRAIEQSQITLAGSPPFHLKAKVFEGTNPHNDAYKAEIEEDWAAPHKWRRTVTANGFSQTLVVNGDQTQEEIKGDYYPNWLRTIVDAILDPGARVTGVELDKSSDNPMIGGTKLCRRFSFRAGIAPVGNNVFSSFCFEDGLIDSVLEPGYDAEYQDYKKFAGKKVARTIREYIKPGEEVEARIEELTEVNSLDESRFAVQNSGPILQTVTVSEEVLRSIATDAPAMQWPAIRGGKAVGVLSIYVCLDRDGGVRETYALNSDHPVMSDAAQQQIRTWKFKPAAVHGTRVQIEGILTFAYEAKIDAKLGQ
jgi:hypothetical protein